MSAAGGDSSGPPTAADNVIFELLSGNVTINSGSVCRSLDCTSGTGSYTGTLTHSSSVTLTIGDGTAGAGNVALKFASGMTYTRSNATSSALSFVSTSATQQTVTTAGKTVGNVTFNGAGGSWLLSDALINSSASQTVALTAGTLNTNGMTVTCGVFAPTGSTTRTLTLGASTITCQSISIAWNCEESTNLTFNANTSTITCSGSGATFSGGGATYNAVNFTGGISSISSTNTFATLSCTGTAIKTCSLQLNSNQTITGTLTLAGNSATNRLLVQSNTLGTARTITNSGATMTWSNVDFRDITLGTSFDASAITGKSGDCGGNSGITFTTAATQTATGTGSFTWSTHGWTTRVPLPQDDVVISNAFTSGRTVTLDMPRAGKSIDWSGATWSGTAVSWAKTTATTAYGSVTMKSGMSNSGTTTFTFEGRGSFTFTSAGCTWSSQLVVAMIGGSMTLQDAFLGTRPVSLANGTLSLNNFNLECTTFDTSNSNTRTLTLGSGMLTCTGNSFTAATSTGLTVTATTGTIKMTNGGFSSSSTFNGGGKTWGNFWYANGAGGGTLSVVGSNTFSDFKDNGSAAHSLTFTVGSTQTVSTFTVSGSSGAVITIDTAAGSTSTHSLVKTGGGTISCDWLNIQHSVATPATTWYAGTNSTNNQAVATAGSGWVFTAPPGGGSAKPWHYYAQVG